MYGKFGHRAGLGPFGPKHAAVFQLHVQPAMFDLQRGLKRLLEIARQIVL